MYRQGRQGHFLVRRQRKEPVEADRVKDVGHEGLDDKENQYAAMDGSVRLWDMATGKLVRSLKHPVLDVQLPEPAAYPAE